MPAKKRVRRPKKVEPQKVADKIVTEARAPIPDWKMQNPEWLWDRKCKLCGHKTAMVNPEVYNEEVYECQNDKCRAQFLVRVDYDLRTSKLIREHKPEMMMGAING
jgi:hypothetical protein